MLLPEDQLLLKTLSLLQSLDLLVVELAHIAKLSLETLDTLLPLDVRLVVVLNYFIKRHICIDERVGHVCQINSRDFVMEVDLLEFGYVFS